MDVQPARPAILRSVRASDYAFFDTRFQALAHRGGQHPGIGENSLRAFARALELGYRYVETDVHATADGVLMAFHDTSLERVTDGHGQITDHTAADLAEVRIGGTDPIPTMAELFETFPQARFNIDLKSAGGIAPLARLLEEYQAYDRVCVASFSSARLAAFRKLTGDRVATGMAPGSVVLLALSGLGTAGWARGNAAQVPARVAAGLLSVVTRRFVEAAHRTGRRVHVWTINDAAEMNRLIDLGVDGIVSDDVVVLKDVLCARGLWEGEA